MATEFSCQVLVLLRDLHGPAEEGVLVGRVLAVPFDNRVDRFEVLEIKRLHREEISGSRICLFLFDKGGMGLAHAAGAQAPMSVKKKKSITMKSG